MGHKCIKKLIDISVNEKISQYLIKSITIMLKWERKEKVNITKPYIIQKKYA